MLRTRAIGLAAFLVIVQAGAGYATTVVVSASGMSFTPPTLTIAPGDSVRWNVGLGFHTTTSGTGSADPQMGVLWNAPLDPSNTTFVRQFNTAGSFPYFCQFHEIMGMKGTVTVNTVPVARDTTVTTPEDVAVGAKLQAFDPDGDGLTYTVLAGPFHGTRSSLNTSTGTFTYTPVLNFNGRDSLAFRVSDGKANSNVDTVYFTVSAVNDPPAAQDVSGLTGINTPHPFAAMPVSDVDNVGWVIAQTSGPFNGSVSLFDPATGSFTYTPNLSFQGSDSIKYTANDGQDISNTATIRIAVIPTCNCPNQGDLVQNGFIDVSDVLQAIKVAFVNGTDIQDPGCPRSRGDVNNSGFVDVSDVLYIIKTAFVNGPNPVNPCL